MIKDFLLRAANSLRSGDPYYNAVSLLLHFDGANNSTTFTDSSRNVLSVTPSGNAKISTTQSKFGGASGSFDGTNSYLSPGSASATQFDFGTLNFTIEGWFYFNSFGGANYAPIFANNYLFYLGSGGQVLVFDGSSNVVSGNSGDVSLSTWTHIAFVRNGTTISVYVNGTQKASATVSASIGTSSTNYIGRHSSVYLNGYIDDLRITNGLARYTANFTVPSAPFSNTVGSIEADAYFPQTSLLLHMDGSNASTAFVDSGPNALAITASGNAQISTSQSKFGGASGAFDGTGDYLTPSSSTPFAFGTGDFTVEFWIYFNNTSSTYLIYDSRPSATNGAYPTIYFDASAGRINYYSSTAVRITGTVATDAGAWHHIALCRSGTSTRLFINGTQSGSTYTDSTSYLSGTSRPTIGADGNSLGANCLNGYIDDLRITKGVARYTSAFTPSAKAFPNLYNPYTTLPTPGASLWLSAPNSASLFTDAGTAVVTKAGDSVYQWNDLSGNSRNATQATSGNRPTWVAPASGRNGLGAVAFNGNGQRIDAASDAAWAFGTGDFTIEQWINLSSIQNNYNQVFPNVPVSGGFSIYYTGPGNYFGVGASSFIVSNRISNYQATAYTWPTNTWLHLAVCRASGNLRIFVNGAQINTTLTNTPNFAQGQLNIGGNLDNAAHTINGMIQNLIIYKGQALYTSNFTPWMS